MNVAIVPGIVTPIAILSLVLSPPPRPSLLLLLLLDVAAFVSEPPWAELEVDFGVSEDLDAGDEDGSKDEDEVTEAPCVSDVKFADAVWTSESVPVVVLMLEGTAAASGEDEFLIAVLEGVGYSV
ncbi:MAG: hypothetical protein Q9222_004469 [Ikaeria aurantiellina]